MIQSRGVAVAILAELHAVSYSDCCQQLSLSCSCRHSFSTEPQEPRRSLLVFTRRLHVSSIADAFQARLKALEMQSAETDRRVAETIARCHQLIAEEQAAEARWRAENPDLL